VSNIILGYTKSRDKEGNIITDESIIFQPVDITQSGDDEKPKKHIYNKLKNF